MPYQEMYYHLFRAVNRSMELLSQDGEIENAVLKAVTELVIAQRECEEMFLSAPEGASENE